jgi:hypothetical protein
MANSIIFLTDNSLDECIATVCQRVLVREAGDIPIVSVSQKPMTLGNNICMGELGRSWLSLYKQLRAGLDAVETENVVIAEHDCLYTHSHLRWQPPRDDTFYYNSNHWLVEWSDRHEGMRGMYSYWPKRMAQSQLVCPVELFKQSNQEILELLDMGLKVDKGLHFYGEPGVMLDQLRSAFVEASSGRPIQLQARLKEYVSKYRTEFFRSEQPSLDIRHGGNFSGPKRGKSRCYDLPPWGKFVDVMETN